MRVQGLYTQLGGTAAYFMCMRSEEEPEALILIKVASFEFALDPLFVLVEGGGALCSKVSKVDGRWDGDAAVALEVAMAHERAHG